MKWLYTLVAGLLAALVIWSQRSIIKRQKDTIKDVKKTINVKNAVNKVNIKSALEARLNVNKATANNKSMRDYLTTGKLRDDKD